MTRFVASKDTGMSANQQNMELKGRVKAQIPTISTHPAEGRVEDPLSWRDAELRSHRK
jgi:hypothetical protein